MKLKLYNMLAIGPRGNLPPRGPPGMPPQHHGPPPSQYGGPGGFPGGGPRLGPPPAVGAPSGPPHPGVPISGITILQAPRPYPSRKPYLLYVTFVVYFLYSGVFVFLL